MRTKPRKFNPTEAPGEATASGLSITGTKALEIRVDDSKVKSTTELNDLIERAKAVYLETFPLS